MKRELRQGLQLHGWKAASGYQKAPRRGSRTNRFPCTSLVSRRAKRPTPPKQHRRDGSIHRGAPSIHLGDMPRSGGAEACTAGRPASTVRGTVRGLRMPRLCQRSMFLDKVLDYVGPHGTVRGLRMPRLHRVFAEFSKPHHNPFQWARLRRTPTKHIDILLLIIEQQAGASYLWICQGSIDLGSVFCFLKPDNNHGSAMMMFPSPWLRSAVPTISIV